VLLNLFLDIEFLINVFIIFSLEKLSGNALYMKGQNRKPQCG